MPNGGPDNCANCRFNRGSEDAGYCALRDVAIANTYWTYCRDFTSTHSGEPLLPKTPTGPIFACGTYEGGVGYVRIPWFGKIAPRFSVPVECWVCGRNVEGGIRIQVGDRTFGFCTNRHYIDWWKIEIDDPNIDSSGLNTPEQVLREPPDDDD